MKISYNWLKQYINLDISPEETGEKLTLLGLEVEDIEKIGSGFDGFVVGDIINVRKHPNADKLVLCDVDLGNEKVQIACGAKNVEGGQKVPVATVGATLPVPMENGEFLTIKKASLRGEVSEGMICSEAELGLSDDHSGIMILSSKAPAGTPLAKIFEIENDSIFEIGLTPNRPDAACHIGVARDLSAVLNKELINPYSALDVTSQKADLSDKISISITDTEKCHRYVALIVENVEIKESPVWLKNRLLSIGLRPVNNVVDVTNFVLHEIGQPLHAFDYDRIRGKKIEVTSFKEGVEFTTLDSTVRKVPSNSLFICDGKGPVAIAGVMGGENSEVGFSTKNILIESAYFEPSAIRKTSKELALQTDSSYRFERGIDPELQLKAAKRAAELIAELSGGKILGGSEDIHPVKHKSSEVHLRISRINRILGTDLTHKEVTSILEKLEFDVNGTEDGHLICGIPSFRPDVSREIDLIEEVGRIFDYNNIPKPDSAPFIAPEPLSGHERYLQKIREFAKSLRYKEISTNSLLSDKEADLLADKKLQIRTLNPVSRENTTLRTHLEAGFLKAVRYNLNRSSDSLRFFEIGHVFQKDDKGTWIDGVREHIHLLFGICGLSKYESWMSEFEHYSVFDLKSDVEAFLNYTGISNDTERYTDDNNILRYSYQGVDIAVLRRTDPSVLDGFDIDKQSYTAEIDLTALFELGIGIRDNYYAEIPKFPVFEFDAAFIVDKSIRVGEMTETIQQEAGNNLKSVSVFDIYEGENLGEDKKSIAFRLTFLDSNKTLTIKDVEPVVQKIVQSLKKATGAKLRS